MYLAKADMTTNPQLQARFDIQGFPTILFFEDGKHEDYTGGRVTYDILNWMRNRVGIDADSDEPSLVEMNNGVIVLTENNFEREIRKHNLLGIEFYAPWCGHCQQLQPEWQEAAKQLAHDEVHLAKVDCTKEQAICDRFDVKAYPTIYFFKGES